MNERSKSIFEMLREPILEAIAEHDLSEKGATELIETLIAEGHEDLLETLKQDAPATRIETTNGGKTRWTC